MNVHDSEKIRGLLSNSGYMNAMTPSDADLIVFNTCSIREKAEQKFYSQLGRIKHLKFKNKDVKIAVAGCVAQDSKDKILKRAPYVDYILGPQNINSLSDLIYEARGMAVDWDPAIAESEFLPSRDSKTRAWVSIMYGCNNFCSYCIVPYTRGREVSRPSQNILSEISQLYDSGYKEITLLGQNVNSYSSDVDFPCLLEKIDRIGVPRVRFVTSHPGDMSSGLVDAMASLKSVCEHIHLPIQSGSDRILKLMNRRYGLEDYINKVNALKNRVPDISITADVIVGFPGETEADYQLTLSMLKEIEFDGLFAFKYSRRKGTRADEFKDHIPEEIKTDRLNRLLRAQEEITHQKNVLLEGTVQEILIEGASESNPRTLQGRTRTNKIVTIENNGEQEGEFLLAEIKHARLHSLEGIRRSEKQAHQLVP
ncbi:MAG: tRNA (N6-isopentenyl adenosine(37)-C2)-methylthiotransferase MiaB [Nitrospirae bacterium]|nr:tRNA (N6-isopentenyl adenosine(37)-C2)-methylthiotransferase MiaB [Nitrospirota bacterium]